MEGWDGEDEEDLLEVVLLVMERAAGEPEVVLEGRFTRAAAAR